MTTTLVISTILWTTSLAIVGGLISRRDVRQEAVGLSRRLAYWARQAVARAPEEWRGLLGRGSKGGAWSRLAMRQRHDEERRRCLDELPELIDVVSLGLSAGISFDAALEIYCERYKTTLSREMGTALMSWQLGLKRRPEALGELAERLDASELRSFVSAIEESLALGAPLAVTLREQGAAVREARRAQRQEQVEKVPVKMLVPIATMVLPAMLVAILGPLVASMSRVA